LKGGTPGGNSKSPNEKSIDDWARGGSDEWGTDSIKKRKLKNPTNEKLQFRTQRAEAQFSGTWRRPNERSKKKKRAFWEGRRRKTERRGVKQVDSQGGQKRERTKRKDGREHSKWKNHRTTKTENTLARLGKG